MLKKLNSPELQCSANHTIPLLDVLSLPGSDNLVLLVLPKLLPFNYLPFETRGEIVEAICQIIESIAFMHSLNIVHGDISPFNMMMDASRVCYDLMFYGYSKIEDLFPLFYTLVRKDPKERADAHAVLDAIRALAEEKGCTWLDEPILRERYLGF